MYYHGLSIESRKNAHPADKSHFGDDCHLYNHRTKTKLDSMQSMCVTYSFNMELTYRDSVKCNIFKHILHIKMKEEIINGTLNIWEII